jgi:hypothetical protein
VNQEDSSCLLLGAAKNRKPEVLAKVSTDLTSMFIKNASFVHTRTWFSSRHNLLASYSSCPPGAHQ